MASTPLADLLPLLRDLAERAAIEVRRERGPDSASSAVVRIKGKPVVMLFPGESPAREAELLLAALRQVDLAGLFVPPAVRERLGG